MKQGQIDAACNLFQRSIDLKPAVGAELNLARCEEERNHLPQALALYQQLHEKLPSSDPRVPILQQRLKLLETRTARVTLVLNPASPPGSVATDQEGRFPLNESRVLMPGEHRVTVSAPGHRPMEYVLQFDAAEVRTVTVTAGSRLEPAATEQVRTSPEKAVAAEALQSSKPLQSPPGGSLPKEPGSSVSPLAYGVLAFGGVSLVVSGIAGLLVLQQNAIVESECTQSPEGGSPECSHEGVVAADRGRLYANIATASFVVGISGVAGGSYLLVQGGTDGPRAALSASVVGRF